MRLSCRVIIFVCALIFVNNAQALHTGPYDMSFNANMTILNNWNESFSYDVELHLHGENIDVDEDYSTLVAQWYYSNAGTISIKDSFTLEEPNALAYQAEKAKWDIATGEFGFDSCLICIGSLKLSDVNAIFSGKQWVEIPWEGGYFKPTGVSITAVTPNSQVWISSAPISPIPLPPSLWLLVSAMVLLFARTKNSKNRVSIARY